MGMGPRANLYRIGGDPLTQLIFYLINFFLNFSFFKRNAEIEKINGKYVVGDPIKIN